MLRAQVWGNPKVAADGIQRVPMKLGSMQHKSNDIVADETAEPPFFS